jgi:uncharacterized membrane protein
MNTILVSLGLAQYQPPAGQVFCRHNPDLDKAKKAQIEARRVVSESQAKKTITAVLDAIRNGADEQPMVSAKTNLSKSSVFIYVNKLNKDGLVIVDKSKRPFKIIAV